MEGGGQSRSLGKREETWNVFLVEDYEEWTMVGLEESRRREGTIGVQRFVQNFERAGMKWRTCVEVETGQRQTKSGRSSLQGILT